MRHHALVLGLLALCCSLNANGAGLIDDNRLLKAQADPGNWLTYGRDYGNQRFSPLAQIDTGQRRAPAPGVDLPERRVVHLPGHADRRRRRDVPVAAVQPRGGAGREDRPRAVALQHKRRTEKMCCGPANRGVAVAYGKVFMGTVDARLIALDQNSGKPVWDVPLVEELAGDTERTEQLAADDPLRKQKVTGSTGVGANMAPVVYKGKVIVGITGVGYGLHLDSDRPGAPLGAVVGIAGQSQRAGFYAAFDAQTGKRIWQFDSTPPSGWEGEFRTSHTRRRAAGSRHRAGEEPRSHSIRTPGSAAAARPGPRPPSIPSWAWCTSASAILRRRWTTSRARATTCTPCRWWRSTSRPGKAALVLPAGAARHVGLRRGHLRRCCSRCATTARRVPAVGQASKTGWLYVLDRRDGKLLYKSEAFVPQRICSRGPPRKASTSRPAAAGGASWSPVSFDARTRTCLRGRLAHADPLHGERNSGDGDKPAVRYTALEPVDGPRWGTLDRHRHPTRAARSAGR